MGRLLAVAIWSLLSAIAFASSDDTAYERTILSYKDGVETLIVQTIQPENTGDYAWIIPVPNWPSISEGTPGALETMTRAMSPYVVHNEEHTFRFFAIVSVLILVVILSVLFTKREKHSRIRELKQATVVLATFSVILFVILYPSLWGMVDEKKVTVTSPVELRELTMAKKYEPRVYGRAALLSWLQTHNFALTEEAASKVLDYAEQDWCFVSCAVRQAPAPTPLVNKLTILIPWVIKFKSDRPVYDPILLPAPNRRIELLTIADKEASIPGMRKIRSTVAKSDTEDRWKPFGHPLVKPLLWEDAKLTYLWGTLRQDDGLSIGWKRFEEGQTRWFTEGAVLQIWQSRSMILLTLTFRYRSRASRLEELARFPTINKLRFRS